MSDTSNREAGGLAGNTTRPTPFATPITTPIADEGPTDQASAVIPQGMLAALGTALSCRGPDLAKRLGITVGGAQHDIRAWRPRAASAVATQGRPSDSGSRGHDDDADHRRYDYPRTAAELPKNSGRLPKNPRPG